MMLQVFADRLNKNLPRSEQWFQKRWRETGMQDSHDCYNTPWCRRIPDVLNHKFKYVIEIDGSYHNKPKQQIIDAKKDRFYLASQYQVFRLKAYDEIGFNALAECIERIRSSFRSIQQPKEKK